MAHFLKFIFALIAVSLVYRINAAPSTSHHELEEKQISSEAVRKSDTVVQNGHHEIPLDKEIKELTRVQQTHRIAVAKKIEHDHPNQKYPAPQNIPGDSSGCRFCSTKG